MRLSKDFFNEDALTLAPKLLGKKIVRRFDDNTVAEFIITEVEAYCGEDDLACHASKGRTKRTEIMYDKGGHVYVYLIYGLYWLLNIVCGDINDPQAVLIRNVRGIKGPGRVGKALLLNKNFYGVDLNSSNLIWLEDSLTPSNIKSDKRIGVNYAKEWADKPYRFYIKEYFNITHP